MTEQASPRRILSARIDPTSYQDASARIVAWVAERKPRYICVANVHVVNETLDDPAMREIVNAADLVTPDGMPLVWLLRWRGVPEATRVYGPTLTLFVCEAAAAAGIPVGFYGGTSSANRGIVAETQRRFPRLKVAYAHSPPFRPLTPEEDERDVRRIVDSGARILFVGLGCPKQEKWMARHRDRLPLVQLGVGAAFAFHAGEVRQAPAWIQRIGMEWAFRLAMEPRRLWKRYLVGNTRFVWLIAMRMDTQSTRYVVTR